MKKKNILIVGFNYGKNVIAKSIKYSKIVSNIYIQNSKNLFFDYKKNYFLKKINLNEFLIKKKINLVILAVPPNLQLKVSKIFIKKKLPIIFEKPLVKNSSELKIIQNLIKKDHYRFAIDFNFLTSKAFEFLISNYLLKKQIKDITINWKIPYRIKKSTWKDNYSKGGGITNNFIIHLISIFVFCYKKIETLHIKKNSIILLVNGSFKVKIFFNYNNTNKNIFELKLFLKKYTLLMKNLGIRYHSGYRIKKINSNNKKSNLIRTFKTDKDDREKCFSKIFYTFLKSYDKKKISPYNLNLGFRAHKILTK